jgi:hypothetical protein
VVSVGHQHRVTLVQITFILLVVIVPLAFGIGWNEHRRNDEVAKIVRDRREMLIDSCERGNSVRRQFRALVEADKEQAQLLIDYMRLDIASKQPSPTAAEKRALDRLTELYAKANAVPILPIVDCQKTIT